MNGEAPVASVEAASFSNPSNPGCEQDRPNARIAGVAYPGDCRLRWTRDARTRDMPVYDVLAGGASSPGGGASESVTIVQQVLWGNKEKAKRPHSSSVWAWMTSKSPSQDAMRPDNNARMKNAENLMNPGANRIA